MSVKHFKKHVVRVDDDYRIRKCDKVVLVEIEGERATPVLLELTKKDLSPGHEVTVVAVNHDILVDGALVISEGSNATFLYTGYASNSCLSTWQVTRGLSESLPKPLQQPLND